MSETFENLINDNQRKIQNIAFSYADQNEREDLIQDILVQLWRSHDQFKGNSASTTWLYRVALNTAITYQRKKISDRKLSQQQPTKNSLNASEQTFKGGHSASHIIEAFSAQLNKIDRAVFVMYVDGLNASEMEAILGTSAGAIKVRINRLKAKFKEQFVD
jgi:RNA polymerase sigma-70 factor, ECF subfamily